MMKKGSILWRSAVGSPRVRLQPAFCEASCQEQSQLPLSAWIQTTVTRRAFRPVSLGTPPLSAQSATRCLSSSSFFHETSGRSRRRHRRHELRQKQQQQQKQSDPSDRGPTPLSFREILFPKPHGELLPSERLHWPRSIRGWIELWRKAKAEYLATWEGFWTSKGFLVEDAPPKETPSAEELQSSVHDRGRQVAANAQRNAQFLQAEASTLRDEIRARTGITSAEDLKRVASDTMRLAADCLKEFMAGYRQGRDDEVDKMLTQYFQEAEKQANQPKRRKRKRRVIRD